MLNCKLTALVDHDLWVDVIAVHPSVGVYALVLPTGMPTKCRSTVPADNAVDLCNRTHKHVGDNLTGLFVYCLFGVN